MTVYRSNSANIAIVALVLLGAFVTAVSVIQGTRVNIACDESTIARAIIDKERPRMGDLEKQFWLDAITRAARKHNLPLPVLVAKIAQESRFRGHVTSAAGAKGAAQLMPMWVVGFDPFEIEINLDKGAEILARELKAVNGDMYRALRRYNGGARNGEAPWNKETQLYAAEVLARVYVAQMAVCSRPQAEQK